MSKYDHNERASFRMQDPNYVALIIFMFLGF